jgi:hypothetical protein
MGSDLTSLTLRQPQPHVDPDLPSGRAHGYRDAVRQREIATDAVRAGARGCLDDPWAEAAWNELPTALRLRLVRANTAIERRPDDERAAVIYQAHVAEAVAYLGSELQVAR